jgi:hypothetical protein
MGMSGTTKADFRHYARDGKRGKVLSHRSRSTATQESRGKPLRAVTRRQLTTFCKQKVVENHYGCVQNVVRKQFLGQRPATQNVWNGRKGNDCHNFRRYARDEKRDKVS